MDEAPHSASHPAPRADFGAPVETFLEKQPPALRAILDELLALIREASPDAQSSLKWGNPFLTVDGVMMGALTAHKSHVNLVLSGPPEAFSDPAGRLIGTSERGRHLRLTDVSEIPRDAVLDWVRTAAALARQKRV